MTSLCKKIVLCIVLFISGWTIQFETLQAQKFSTDSLYYLLQRLHDEIDSNEIKTLIKDAQSAVMRKGPADSLATRLLAVENAIIPFGKPYPKNFSAYAETLLSFTKSIPPEGESGYYEQSLFNAADLYRNNDQDLRSSQLFELDLVLRKKLFGPKDPRYEKCLDYLALEYVEIWQFKKALPLLEESLQISKDLVDERDPEYANHLNTLGNLYYQWDEYEKALPLFQQALKINRDAVKEKKLTETHLPLNLHNLATTYIRLGQYEKALPLTQEAFAISKKLHEDDPYAFVTTSLASLYTTMGEYEKALPLYKQALSTIKNKLGESHINYPRALTNLAILYENTGDYQLAIPLLKEALLCRENILGIKHPDYAMSLLQLANAYEYTGQFKQAMVLTQNALEIYSKVLGNECREVAIGLSAEASLYQRLGRQNEALPLFLRALSIREKIFGNQHPDYANSLKDVGLLYASKNPDSVSLLIRSNSLITSHLFQNYSSLSENEKMKLYNKLQFHYCYLPSIAFTKNSSDRAINNQIYTNYLTVKGIVLDNQQHILRSIRNNNDPKVLELYLEWKRNRSFLAEQLLLPVAMRVLDTDSLQQINSELEQSLSNVSHTFRDQLNYRQVSFEDVRSTLAKDQVAIEFIRFKLYKNNRFTDSVWYAALVVLPGDSTCKFIPLTEERRLQRLFRLTENKANSPPAHNFDGRISSAWSNKLYDSLYRLIWMPLENYCRNAKTVYYSPIGLLNRVAFQALRSDTDSLLIEKYRLQQLVSTRILPHLEASQRKPESASVWGDIDYNQLNYNSENGSKNTDTISASFNFYNSGSRGLRGQEWVSLPESKKEIDSVRLLFSNSGIAIKSFGGKMANEENFKTLDGNSPQLIHIATHGFFLQLKKSSLTRSDHTFSDNFFTIQQDPMFRSGLVFAGGNHAWKGEKAVAGKDDGILTSYEISQLDLSKTDLLVLSACETALGDIEGEEGVMGLQRAFKLAGVKQMILSLWRVPDKETRELMILFYKNLLNGEPASEALRSAQLKMSVKYSPYYWAAFVLVE